MVKVCPSKEVPKATRKDEYWMPMDEDSFKMRNMEKTMKRMTKHGYSLLSRGSDGWDDDGSDGWDEEEDDMDPMERMMAQMGGELWEEMNRRKSAPSPFFAGDKD